MKKIISVILSAVMAFSFLSASAFAEIKLPSDTVLNESAEESTPLYKQMLPYHYSKLSDEGKSIYLKIRKAAIGYKKSIEIKQILDPELIIQLVDIIFYEDALAFNVKQVSYYITDKSTEFEFGFTFTEESAEKMLRKMDAVAKKVTSKFTEKTSDYAKILYIHDYITKNTVYDESLNSAHSAYGSMIVGKAVCEGYARAFGYICSKAGIKTVNVVGTATTEDGETENHMWNKVYYKKKWYDLDLTWDDPVSDYTENRTYKYFMTGSTAFKKSHKAGGTSLKYPKSTADTSMNYYVKKDLVADDNASAHSLLAKEIAQAAKKGRTSATIMLSDEDSFNSFKSYLENDDYRKTFSILADASNRTKEPIVTGRYYAFYADKRALTVSIYFIVKNTSIYDYFTDTSELTDYEILFFRSCGIVFDEPSEAA